FTSVILYFGQMLFIPLFLGLLIGIVIPYIGIFISALLPVSVVWMQTGNIWYPLGVIAVFSFVQYLEAKVIFPTVVGKQLHVSTWKPINLLLSRK
ncbi:MAG: AI-2E family transporter, partial [Pyrinomonadaceae bacterium]|nr:AI-2E family transporter [Sphingobacteriaceae bacterium]